MHAEKKEKSRNSGLTGSGNSYKEKCPFENRNDTGGYLLATHQSAIKRSKQNEKRRLRNISIKSSVRTEIKTVVRALETKDAEQSKAALMKVIPVLTKAAAKGVFHKKTASRKISRLTKKVNALKA
jgi:small subunit ribosomal protein S20